MKLNISGYITRPEVGGGNLNIQDFGKYQLLDGTSRGGIVHVRNEVTGPAVHGRTLIHARKDIVLMKLIIRVYGDTMNDLEANVTELGRALEQFRYRISLTIEGETGTWICQPGDWATNDDGTYDKIGLMLPKPQQTVVASVPRDPIPIEGGV